MINHAAEGISLVDGDSSIGKSFFEVFSIAQQDHVTGLKQIIIDSTSQKVQITMKELITCIDVSHQSHQYYFDVSPMINESGIVRGSVIVFRSAV